MSNSNLNTLSTPSKSDPVTPLVLNAFSVLVVDDSKTQRTVLKAQLRRLGFNIMEADSGDSALEICMQNRIDLVLSDWMMPGMSGLEFCKKFKALKRSSYGYFILLTSKSDAEDVAVGLDHGADDFLSKPVGKDELRARIRAGKRIHHMHEQLQVQFEKTNETLLELQEVHNAIQKDLAEAEKLQKSLIPNPAIWHGSSLVSNIFISSGHVGGDLVGQFKIDQDRLALFSADVSGHGVSSALLTIRLAGYFSPTNKEQNIAFEKTKSGQFRSLRPSEIAARLNSLMLQEMETDLYFTLAYTEVDLRSGTCSLVQAGHPHPVRISKSGQVEYLGNGGPPIGLIDDVGFEDCQFTLQNEDKLLLYSDGLTECENPNGALLDESGLEKILKAHNTKSGREFLDDIVWDLTDFAQSNTFNDDLSAILFEWSKDPKND